MGLSTSGWLYVRMYRSSFPVHVAERVKLLIQRRRWSPRSYTSQPYQCVRLRFVRVCGTRHTRSSTSFYVHAQNFPMASCRRWGCVYHDSDTGFARPGRRSSARATDAPDLFRRYDCQVDGCSSNCLLVNIHPIFLATWYWRVRSDCVHWYFYCYSDTVSKNA